MGAKQSAHTALPYGGGLGLELRVAGLPFTAIEPFETWTDLRRRARPQGHVQAPASIYGFAQDIPRDRYGPKSCAF